MPRFSVLIPAYNVEPYIDVCLESVCSQSFADFEVIVVDDASTDGTAARLSEWAKRDERIRVITHEENQGLHSARKTAVEASKGDYCFFLDSDDEIAPRLYETLASFVDRHDADMVHFGMRVVPETPEDMAIAFDYETMYNNSFGDLHGEEILQAAYSEKPQGNIAWNVWSVLYRGSMLRRAWDLMPRKRLERSEDAYEYFVIASQASLWVDLTCLRGAIYHIGRGVSTNAVISWQKFAYEQAATYTCYRELCAYVSGAQRESWVPYVDYFKKRCLEVFIYDFTVRLRGDEFDFAARALKDTWGTADAIYVLAQAAIRRGRWLEANNLLPEATDHFTLLGRIIESICKEESEPMPAELEALMAHFASLAAQRDVKIREDQELHEGEFSFHSLRHPRFYELLHCLFPQGSTRQKILSRLCSVIMTYASIPRR